MVCGERVGGKLRQEKMGKGPPTTLQVPGGRARRMGDGQQHPCPQLSSHGDAASPCSCDLEKQTLKSFHLLLNKLYFLFIYFFSWGGVKGK